MCGGSHADRAADLQCNEEIEDDSVSISSKRPTPGLCPWERPAKRMRTAASPAVKVGILS